MKDDEKNKQQDKQDEKAPTQAKQDKKGERQDRFKNFILRRFQRRE